MMALVTLAPCHAAEPATIDEARIVAQQWVAHVTATDGSWGGCANPTVGASDEVVTDGQLVAYKFDVRPTGHVLVPAIKELPPIKSYSTTGDFLPNSPDYYECVVEDLAAVFKSLKRRDLYIASASAALFTTRNRSAWGSLLGARTTDTVYLAYAPPVAIVAGPLVGARWDQDYPYNIYCPTVGGNRTMVGCLATAVAQIMKYWNYPSVGAGSHCYTWAGDGGGSRRLCANFQHDYNWDLMLNSVNVGSPSESIDAVGRLMSDVGIAVEMDYGVYGSGAYLEPVLTAMPNYFGYSSEIARIYRKNYPSDDAWFTEFKSEIDAVRPVLFAIYGSAGGHAAVVDGYRMDTGINFVHVNFGWSGYCDNYYSLNGIQAGGYTFDDHRWEAMIRNIRPAGSTETTAMAVDGPWADGNINWPSDTDWFSFTITQTGNYIIDTRAGTLTDTFATLYGPNSRSQFVEEDNDDGDGQCAKITRLLTAGTYYLAVRANVPTAVGTYQARVTTGNSVDHIEISGPAALLARDVAYYSCAAVYRDGSRATVTPIWSETCRYATISSAGQLRTQLPRAIVNFEVRASYSDNGRRYTAALPVALYPIGRLMPDGRPVKAAINTPGEVDWHILQIRTAAMHSFHVSLGTLSDAGIYLYNPGGFLQGAVSQAPGDMPSFARWLDRGVYLIAITGARQASTGTYKVWVKPE